LQPLLHDLISNVAAPALVLSREDGQIPGSGVAGWFADDVRLVNVVQVGVEGSGLDLVRSAWPDAAHADFTYVARGFGDEHADPTVFVDRRRCLDAEGLEERLVVSSSAQTPVRMRLVLTCGADMTPMTQVKQGAVPAQLPAQRDGGGLRWTGRARWSPAHSPRPTPWSPTRAGWSGTSRWTPAKASPRPSGSPGPPRPRGCSSPAEPRHGVRRR
jgi:hypothetical protein